MTERVFVCGQTGSGKSQYVRHMLGHPSHGRTLVIDPVGDYRADTKHFTVGGALQEIRDHIYRGRQRWQVVASLERSDMATLVEALVPSRDVYSSFVRALPGGLTVVLEEVDIITPRGQGGEKLAGLFRRGRHVGLSAIAVTQRPSNVSKEVVAQAERVVAYRLSDPADLAYLAQRCSAAAVATGRAAWRTPHTAVVWDRGAVGVLTPNYQERPIRAPDLLDPP